jgi:hypothetical protein
MRTGHVKRPFGSGGFEQRARSAARSFGRGLVEPLARERQEHEPVLEQRLSALAYCLAALEPADRELIRKRYEDKARANDLLDEAGVSRRTLFRTLDRIRRRLHDGINRRLAAEA